MDEHLMYIEFDAERNRVHLEPYKPMGEQRYGVPMISNVIYTIFLIAECQKEYNYNMEHGYYEEAEEFIPYIEKMQDYVRNSYTFRNTIFGGKNEQTD